MISFAIMSSFIVMNLVVAVICDALVHLNEAGKILLLSSSESMTTVASVEESTSTAKHNYFEEEKREGLLQLEMDRLLHQMEKINIMQRELQETVEYLVSEMLQSMSGETESDGLKQPLNEIA